MSVRNLLTLNAVLVLLVALTGLFAPTVFIELTGLELSQSTINLERAFGAVVIGNTLVSWLLRSEPPSRTRKAVLLGFGVNYLVFAAVNVVNILSLTPASSATPWAIFGMNALLGLAFLYFWRQEPA